MVAAVRPMVAPATERDVIECAEVLLDTLGRLDPALLPGDTCGRVVECLVRVEKATAAARSETALRAVDCGEHGKAGYRHGSVWLARLLGVTRDEARAQLETARACAALPLVRDRLASGALSWRQAEEIAKTEAAVPGSHRQMADLAERSDLSALRAEGRGRRLRAIRPEDLDKKQKAAQSLRTWTNDFGNICGNFELAPVRGVAFLTRLQHETDRLFREALRAGRRPTREQLAAEALLSLVSSGGTGSGVTELVVVVGLRSLLAGTPQPGEPCHVIGGGPIPVPSVLDLAEDAFIKAVLYDGTKIDTVVHYGRRRKLPAVLRTALQLGAAPGFEGAVCARDGCGCRFGLQWDHRDPWANGGPTSLANLDLLCVADHIEKTKRDRAAGLLGRRRVEWDDDGERGPP